MRRFMRCHFTSFDLLLLTPSPALFSACAEAAWRQKKDARAEKEATPDKERKMRRR